MGEALEILCVAREYLKRIVSLGIGTQNYIICDTTYYHIIL